MARLVILLYICHVFFISAENLLIQTEGNNKIDLQHWQGQIWLWEIQKDLVTTVTRRWFFVFKVSWLVTSVLRDIGQGLNHRSLTQWQWPAVSRVAFATKKSAIKVFLSSGHQWQCWGGGGGTRVWLPRYNKRICVTEGCNDVRLVQVLVWEDFL